MEAVNNLVLEQQGLADSIQRLIKNCKKDATARKTESYIENRKASLEDLWSGVLIKHEKIKKENCPQHNYFTTDYFNQIKKLYEGGKKYLAECAKAEEKSKKEEDEELQKIKTDLLNKKEVHLELLETLKIKIQLQLQEERSENQYIYLLKELEDRWASIKNCHNEILAQVGVLMDREYYRVHEDAADLFQETADELQQRIKSMMELPNTSLPQIKIPYFNGNYEEWPTFYDIFCKVIHEKRGVSKTEKMKYLKTHLRGEAQNMIKHLHITEANYDDALDILKKRYHNERLIASNLVDRILDLPTIHVESATQLKQLHDVIKESLEGIKNLRISTAEWGPIIGRIIARKWDKETNRLYEQNLLNPQALPALSEILEFLQRRFYSLEASARASSVSSQSFRQKTYGQSCYFCKQEHTVQSCPKLKALPVSDRIKAVKERKLCLNCLKHNFKEKCETQGRCRICNGFHNTLLHMEKNALSLRRQPNLSREVHHTSSMENEVLLATAMVTIQTLSGTPQMFRVLIDQGSQSAFISEEAAQLLGLPRQKIRAEVTGLGNGEPKISSWKIEARLTPRFTSQFSLNTQLLVLPKLTKSLPKNPIPGNQHEKWHNQILADPTFDKPGPIDIVLGAEEYGKIILEGLRKHNGLIGQNTEFGWIISGQVLTNTHTNLKVTTMVTFTEEDAQLTKFWEMEEVAVNRTQKEEDLICEEFYTKTTVRDDQGKYTVKIPFKEQMELGESRARAVARLMQLEKKFAKDENLKNQYVKFMEEYLQLGHMKKVNRRCFNQGKYYIPHQPVIREESTTTKLRVVFDASCKTSNNVSLNQTMYVGPRLQQDISEIILRWRKHNVAFIADVEKMYRQIKVHEEDQPYQRILWRFKPTEPVQEFELTTVTYGTASAPYLAIRTLQQLAKDERKNYPLAAKVVEKDFYVDDCLSGHSNVKEAKELQQELINMFQSAGFSLRKWSSNHPELLEGLPKNLRSQAELQIAEDEPKKSLGIWWTPTSDNFGFRAKITDGTKVTKRHILSEIAKIFDPMGWLSPFIIKAKLIIQELWLRNMDWDMEVDQKIGKEWKKFQEETKQIDEIKISRWIHYNGGAIEVHGFCDASEKAYGAVTYSRTEINGKVHITLLQAKSKVAPARNRVTLPRLELSAALLLAKLMEKTVRALEVQDVTMYAWTDSMITLGWIKGDPLRWKTFVGNRTSEIRRMVPPECWNHVKSAENPADVISRGMDLSTLKNYSLWWNAPEWLPNQKQWPKTLQTPKVDQEVKMCHQAYVKYTMQEWNRFSDLKNMVRVMSYCLRWKKGCPRNTPLSVNEMCNTLKKIIRSVQKAELSEEYQRLMEGKSIDKKSKICNLNPFLDKDEVLRVGGRLENSQLPYDEKHAMILPYKCHLTDLVIRDAHIKNLHGGNALTLSNIRRQFWIINGKKAVKSALGKCITCIRYKAQAAQQIMGELPKPRVTPSPPFTHTGVDYAGPIQIRTTKGRGHKSYKGYIAILVCLATKAIHLEVVSDMTTDSFLAAYRRFTARRGQCAHIYSDNGTTFIGAAQKLQEEVLAITKSPRVEKIMSNGGTQWHFIPPSAPHFGGIWEAGVKSMKYHLKRVIGETTLTYEELATLTQQIEACLNSRPLCPLSEDPDEITALTPGHFLIGRPLLSTPAHLDKKIYTLTERWKLVQKMKKDFWKNWSSEYLSRLQVRYKWNKPQENLKENTLVIIKEDNVNPAKWPLARIKQVHPGSDGAVRVVTLKTEKGTYKRPIAKLIPLPLDEKMVKMEEPATLHKDVNFMRCNVKRKSTGNYYLTTLLFLLMFSTIPYTKAGYKIEQPQKGLYIEHLGIARVERGVFRIQVNYEKSKIKEDSSQVSDMVTQFKKLCKDAEKLTQENFCLSLIQHLEEQESHINTLKGSMQYISHTRKRRGVLGKLMTAVFGVNDEVYEDIDRLEKNQEELIKASHHQTKFMLSTTSKINETENRIANQLNRFRTKLNEGIKAINDMQSWYKSTDINKLNIHVLGTYQQATNFIAELEDYHKKLFKIMFNHGNLYDITSPAHVNRIIQETNRKLPTNLRISPVPLVNTKIEQDDELLRIYGYFVIEDIAEFNLFKVIPTPLKIENESYLALDLDNEVLAVDYNNQLYFQIDDEELKNCIITVRNNFVCSPKVVKSIENSPNCVIDEVYQRTDSVPCGVRKNAIKGIIWKQLYMPNTWLFICNKETKVAITCNGIREDVLLNKTGILQITQDCIINTKENIISPKRIDTQPILGSYSKGLTNRINTTVEIRNRQFIEKEPVFTIKDNLRSAVIDEEKLMHQVQEHVWKKIHTHTYISNIITAAVILTVVLGAWGIFKKIKHNKKVHNRSPQDSKDVAMVELQPLDIENSSSSPAECLTT